MDRKEGARERDRVRERERAREREKKTERRDRQTDRQTERRERETEAEREWYKEEGEKERSKRERWKTCVLLVLLLCMCFFVVAFIFFFEPRYRLSERIHRDALWGVLRSPVSYFDTTMSGRIINKFSSDLANVRTSQLASYRNTIRSMIQDPRQAQEQDEMRRGERKKRVDEARREDEATRRGKTRRRVDEARQEDELPPDRLIG
jgi:hypothetical protein